MIYNAADIKIINKEKILYAIQQHNTLTKSELVSETELSMGTCSTILNELHQDGAVFIVDQEKSIVGRPRQVYRFNSDFNHVLSVTLEKNGNTCFLNCAVIDALGNIIESELFTHKDIDYHFIEHSILKFLRDDNTISSIGIGVPSIVSDGVIENCAMEKLNGINIQSQISKTYNINVFVINDVNATVYRLYREHGNPRESMVAIYFPHEGYVGSGIMLEGRLHKGTTMFAGESNYLGRAFGITKEKQREITGGDIELFSKFGSQILTSIICTINPSTVFLLGTLINEETKEKIKTNCMEFIPKDHIPNLIIENDFSSTYLMGVADYTLDHVQFPYTRCSEL